MRVARHAQTAAVDVLRRERIDLFEQHTVGSTTTPLPMIGVMCGYSTPLGTNCRAKASPSTTRRWPALWPPW